MSINSLHVLSVLAERFFGRESDRFCNVQIFLISQRWLLYFFSGVKRLMTMALSATCSLQSLQYFGVVRASVGCSETARITLTHQQVCWSKSFQTVGLGILRNEHFSQCPRRPKRQHFVRSRKANLRPVRPRRVSYCPPSTLSSERSVQLGSLHQCEALPASKSTNLMILCLLVKQPCMLFVVNSLIILP